MPRSFIIDSVFEAHTACSDPDLDRLVKDGPPASRQLGLDNRYPSAAFQQIMLIKTALENRPAPMRLLSLPLFFLGESGSTNLAEYIQIFCRILQLSTPNSLNIECVVTEEGISEAGLRAVRLLLCPALWACDSLVHIGVSLTQRKAEPPTRFIDLLDDVFSSTPSCHSLYVFGATSHIVSVVESLQRVIRKRTAAYVNDTRFRKITRIRAQFCFIAVNTLAVELSRGLRVADFLLQWDGDFFCSPKDLPEYLSLDLTDPNDTSQLAVALSTQDSSLRGLELWGQWGFPASIAQVFGNAIASSQLEEIKLMPALCAEVLAAFAEGVSRSRLRHVQIHCADGCDLEGALTKILACSSLREITVIPPWSAESLSDAVIELVLNHRGLENYQLGGLLPEDEAYEIMCRGNVAQSIRVLTVLLLQWVASFTELPAVDVNLFRFIREMMITPTD